MRRPIALLALMLLPAVSHAQSGLLSGLFLGGAWQSSSIDGGGSGSGGNTVTADLDRGSGALLIAGWQPLPLLGVVVRSSSTNFDAQAGDVATTIKQTEILGRLTFPLTVARLTPFVEAGFALRDFEADALGVATITADGNSPIIGGGLRLRLLQGVQLEGAYHVVTGDFKEWALNGGAISDDAIKAGTGRITVGAVVHPFALLKR